MVKSRTLFSMYFVTLTFLEIHSVKIERGNPTLLFLPGQDSYKYEALWNSENSCECTDGDKNIFMSDDGQAYKCMEAKKTGCGGITLVDDTTKKINTSCESLKITTIYIWGLASKNKNESNGSWFNRTTTVNKYFQVTDSNKINVADIDINQWSGQLVKLEVERCSSKNSKPTNCFLVRFKGKVDYPYDLEQLNFKTTQKSTIAPATTKKTTTMKGTTALTKTTATIATTTTVPTTTAKSTTASTKPKKDRTSEPKTKKQTSLKMQNPEAQVDTTTASIDTTTSNSTALMVADDRRKTRNLTVTIIIITSAALLVMIILAVIIYIIMKKRSSNRKDLKHRNETPMRDVTGKNQDQRLSGDYNYTNPYFETSPSALPITSKPTLQTNTKMVNVCNDVSPKSDIILVNNVYDDAVIAPNHASPNVYTSVNKTESHYAASKNVINSYGVLSQKSEESNEPLKKLGSQTIEACSHLNTTNTPNEEFYQLLVKSGLKTGDYALPDTSQTYAAFDNTHPNDYLAPSEFDPKTHSNYFSNKDPYYHVLEDVNKTSRDPLHTNDFKKTSDEPKKYTQLDVKGKDIYQPLNKSVENFSNLRNTKSSEKFVDYASLDKPAETTYQELSQPRAGENKTIVNAQGIYEQPQMSSLPTIKNKHAAIENLAYQENSPNYDEILSAEVNHSQDVNHYSSPNQDGNVYHVLEACE